MNPFLTARFDDPQESIRGARRLPENEDADPVGPIGAATQPKPVPDSDPKPRDTEQEKVDFTSEGSPPPGKVGGASGPATTEHEVRTQRPKENKH